MFVSVSAFGKIWGGRSVHPTLSIPSHQLIHWHNMTIINNQTTQDRDRVYDLMVVQPDCRALQLQPRVAEVKKKSIYVEIYIVWVLYRIGGRGRKRGVCVSAFICIHTKPNPTNTPKLTKKSTKNTKNR